MKYPVEIFGNDVVWGFNSCIQVADIYRWHLHPELFVLAV